MKRTFVTTAQEELQNLLLSKKTKNTETGIASAGKMFTDYLSWKNLRFESINDIAGNIL